MSVPTYEAFMLPLLKRASDQGEHTLAESIDPISEELCLSEADRRELLPSGTQKKVNNRLSWACVYLAKAGLLTRTGRGRFKITDRGLEVVRQDPGQVDAAYLNRFPEFVEFKRARRAAADGNRETADSDDSSETPEERLEASYQLLRRSLAQELLEKVRTCSPRFFEQLVVDLLVAMGYGGSRGDAGQAVGRTGDGGIDGVIKEDKLGLDAVYVQAKRWESTVGRPIVQAFAGSLEGVRARKGILLTTSDFSADARDYVLRIEKRIVLISGEQLAEFMIDHDIGVTKTAAYVVKKVDFDYFAEG